MRDLRFTIALVFLLPFVASAEVATAQVRCASDAEQTTLLELFTSEGCSSCPPAEAWLSRLVDSPKLWKEFVPVAFHVDYWDKLGWPDRFASPAFTERQRGYVAAWRQRTMYTPGFVVNGQEAGSTGRASMLERPRGTPGVLIAEQTTTNRWDVQFTPAAGTTGPFTAHMAVLDGGVKIKVARGENAGRELTHDFVARFWQTTEVQAVAGTMTAEMTLPDLPRITGARRALAVWVSRRGELTPVQSTGTWLP